ncbi:MAG: sugar ABC transporter substrate-binding protein [Opitutaceae bacterium]|nr:sugar ABC transporter substrate-binding protein [Opitutaceae bacterium]
MLPDFIDRRRELVCWMLVAALAALGFWWAAKTRGPQEPTDTRQTITWLVTVGSLRDLFEAQVAAFEKENPDLRVSIVWVPESEYQVKFKTLAAAGQSPDVFLAGDVWIAALRPFLLDLAPLVARDATEVNFNDYPAAVRTAITDQDRVLLLPSTMNLSLLYYNVALFEEAGLAPPDASWTWDDFLRAGDAFTAIREKTGRRVYGAGVEEGWWGEWLIYVRQAGGQVFSADGRRCLLDSPESIRGITFYHDKVARGISPRRGYGVRNGFINGSYAMLIGGHVNQWALYNLAPALRWDIAPLPIGPGGRAGGEIAIEGYGIARDTPRAEAAWRLVKFLTRPDAVRDHVARGALPVRESVARETFFDRPRVQPPRNTDAILIQLEEARPIPRLSDFIEVMLKIVQPEIDLMMEGRRTPEEAARRAAAAANAHLDTLAASRTPPAP